MCVYIYPTGDIEKIFHFLSKTEKPLVREPKLMLKIEWLQPVTSVIVDNIKEKSCTEDYLGMYFSNKSKSGGAEVNEVKVFGRGRALVTFKDPNSEFVCCIQYVPLYSQHVHAFIHVRRYILLT